ncbi:MAG: GAF domain-containing protein, partial [Luteibacter sp.]
MSEPAPLPIEASELARLERLLIALSARFISLPPSEVDAAIDQAVKAVVMAIDIDRCALVRVLPEQRAFVRVSAWTSEGLRPAVLAEPVTTYPWSLARLEQGESIIFSSAEELPPEAAGDKAAYTGNYSDISFVSVPLLVAGSLLGALNFLSLARRRTWPPEL